MACFRDAPENIARDVSIRGDLISVPAPGGGRNPEPARSGPGRSRKSNPSRRDTKSDRRRRYIIVYYGLCARTAVKSRHQHRQRTVPRQIFTDGALTGGMPGRPLFLRGAAAGERAPPPPLSALRRLYPDPEPISYSSRIEIYFSSPPENSGFHQNTD